MFSLDDVIMNFQVCGIYYTLKETYLGMGFLLSHPELLLYNSASCGDGLVGEI